MKFGTVEVPLSYIKMDSGNEQTPNQREEIKAERDDYTRALMRVTADGMITNQSFVFRRMNIKERRALKNVMKSGLVDEKQRKYRVTYWNDENLQYEEGDVYIPDITFSRAIVSDEGIVYNEFTMTLIGYETSKAVT